MSKRKLCKVHQREKLEKAERKLMESWLCLYLEDVFCPHSEIPEKYRDPVLCKGCKHYDEWYREMEREEEEEDEAAMELLEEIARTGVWK